MARVTVEDCVTKIPNRFRLVMLASQRARNVSAGAQLTVDRDNDKNPVIALREIADETVDLSDLEEQLVRGLQKFVEMDEPEEDDMDLLAIQQDLAADLGDDEADGAAGADAFSSLGDDAASLDEAGDIMLDPDVKSEGDDGEKENIDAV